MCDHATPVYTAPVSLPNVYCLWVGDAVLSRLVVQQVKEVFDSQWDGTTGAEDHGEQIVHKLLQRPLRNTKEEMKESQTDLVLMCSLLSNDVITGNESRVCDCWICT